MDVARIVRTFHNVKRWMQQRLDLKHLYERIRAAREAAGKSVNQAAEELGVKRTQIWRMEHEAETLSAKRLFELADLYNVDARELFEGESSIKAPYEFFDRIGDVVMMVEGIVQQQKVRPSPDLIRDAVIEVLKQDAKRPIAIRNQLFDPALYEGLVSLIFKRPK